jgi:hypothetical protein
MLYKGNYNNELHYLQTLCLSFDSYPKICHQFKNIQEIRAVKEGSIKGFF